ncbi:hypothetical protein N7444_002801 [Penicillium canescens]|nr:hypothetical protein N7444_002801 [Penicillium canescens]
MLFRTVHRPSLQASELNRLLGPSQDAQVNEGIEYDEVDRYLREATVSIPPRAYWKENERKFPVLSRLARDLLSVLLRAQDGQEALEEDEALKETEDDIAPISDVEENGPIEDSETGLAVEGWWGVRQPRNFSP